jgi:hypothetical protein
MAAQYLTYFHSCFTFEGLPLSISSTFSFSLQLSFLRIPPVQAIILFVSGVFLAGIAPVTLGFTAWTAYMMRAFVFLAICGSGTSIAEAPGMSA